MDGTCTKGSSELNLLTKTRDTKFSSFNKTDKSNIYCVLDENGYVNFQNILQLFNFPINEIQAWAICYQITKFILKQETVYKICDFSQLLLHKNGHIKIEITDDGNIDAISEKEAVFSLGVLIFNALDYGLSEEEEVHLCSELQNLIIFMTDFHEGRVIEDAIKNEQKTANIEVLEFFQHHLSQSEDYLAENVFDSIRLMCIKYLQANDDHQADVQYKTVLSSLVTEALELSSNLKQEFIGKESIKLDNEKYNSNSLQLSQAHYRDWIDRRIWTVIQMRFWGQIIDEYKVKNTLNIQTNFEKRLQSASEKITDFKLREILMDDIKKQRYSLRKTSVQPSCVKKDTYSIILDFIKSKPQLKKACDRELRPLKKECNLHEKLMESIKKPPKPLKCANEKVSSKHISHLHNNSQMEKETEVIEHTQSCYRNMRKLIPVDFDLKLDEDDECDDDDHVNFEFKKHNCKSTLEDSPCCPVITKENKRQFTDPWDGGKGLRLSQSEYHRFCDTQLESYDLATQCLSRNVSARRHAVNKSRIPHLINDNLQSRPHNSRKNCLSISKNKRDTDSIQEQYVNSKSSINKKPIPKPRNKFDMRKTDNSKDVSSHENIRPTLGEILLEDKLSLTLEEIVHIRSVLTKAELESLPVEGRVKEDVEKRRVCFLCLKTRFGLLGPWGQRCRLCERTICVKCYSKMRIPTDHFAHVPVILLSPGLLLSSPLSDTNSGISKNSWSLCRNSFGSAPTSPATKRYYSELQKDVSTKISNKISETQEIPKFLSTSGASLKDISSYVDKENTLKSSGSPSKLSSIKTFGTFSRKGIENERDVERLHGVSMVVCHDCRLMVIQIIKSSRITRTNLRNNVISRLTLDLSPAYI